MQEIPDKPYFTASEVAELLLVSTNSVRVWANKGLLKSELTLGGHRRFPRQEILRLLQERLTHANKETKKEVRILVIDDDETFCHLITKGIENSMPEAVVAFATDGFGGGMLARSSNPHVILLDLRMPGLDGFQICRMLKADDATRHIRVIAISGSHGEKERKEILEAGAEELLEKPVAMPQLVQMIRSPQLGRN